MILTDPLNQLPELLAEVLGIETEEINDEADFRLDYNATPQDLKDIQHQLEEALEITLPDFTSIDPFTFGDLKALIEDSIL
jgi:acyl carrier protein